MRRWWNGRHASLRSWWAKALVGSNPALRTSTRPPRAGSLSAGKGELKGAFLKI